MRALKPAFFNQQLLLMANCATGGTKKEKPLEHAGRRQRKRPRCLLGIKIVAHLILEDWLNLTGQLAQNDAEYSHLKSSAGFPRIN